MKTHLVVLLSLTSFLTALVTAEESKNQPRWEYKVFSVSDRTTPQMKEEKLNELGRNGWELVSAVWQTNTPGRVSSAQAVFYLKRVRSDENVTDSKVPQEEIESTKP